MRTYLLSINCKCFNTLDQPLSYTPWDRNRSTQSETVVCLPLHFVITTDFFNLCHRETTCFFQTATWILRLLFRPPTSSNQLRLYKSNLKLKRLCLHDNWPLSNRIALKWNSLSHIFDRFHGDRCGNDLRRHGNAISWLRALLRLILSVFLRLQETFFVKKAYFMHRHCCFLRDGVEFSNNATTCITVIRHRPAVELPPRSADDAPPAQHQQDIAEICHIEMNSVGTCWLSCETPVPFDEHRLSFGTKRIPEIIQFSDLHLFNLFDENHHPSWLVGFICAVFDRCPFRRWDFTANCVNHLCKKTIKGNKRFSCR